MKFSVNFLLAMVVIAIVALLLAPTLRTAFQGFPAWLADKADSSVKRHMARNGMLLTMATLAADKPRPYELGTIGEFPIIAADIIYEGAAVGENAAGYARPLVAGDPFLGFAESTVDNSAGAAGDKRIRVRRLGQVQLAVAGATAITANDGAVVYASDDDTFTLTASTNTAIGKVSRWVESGVCVVDFKSVSAV